MKPRVVIIGCGFGGIEAVRKLSTAAQGYDLVGRAEMRLGDPQAALRAFQQAALLNPEDALARDHVILAAFAAGHSIVGEKAARIAISETATD